MRKAKYDKALLEQITPKCTSIAQVIKSLGLKPAGGTHSHISKKLKEFGIDTSHFLGQASNCGQNHKGGVKCGWQEVLVERQSGNRQKAYRLRRALIESGTEYKCIECGRSNWRGKKLVLQVNHKNSNWLDDRKENLEFLCPNCHSQTPGWCGEKGHAELDTCAGYHRQRRKGRVVKLADTQATGQTTR